MGKPPPSRQNVVPRRPSADFEREEATTLDPFVLDEDEVVVVPKGSTEAIRDDLRADPDVQDALRWLDPPSNAGPAIAAIQVMVPVPPPDGTGHVPSDRHPSQPAYAQVYTPLPQAYPGAGPYPTPVPTYVPNSGAYYLATPMPGPAPMQAAPSGRSPILWILLTALVTGGGIALGWLMFAGRQEHSAEPAPAARAPVTPAPQAHPVQTPSPPPPPKAEPVVAQVATVTRGETTTVMAPMSGQVGKVFLAAPGKVAAGDKLIEIRTTSGGGSKAKKLAARVAELENLAKDDPVYEDFLDQARTEQKAARGKSETLVVKANDAGLAQVEVKQGDEVTTGDPIAHIAKGGDWILAATVKNEVQRSWPCSVALANDKKATCTIEKVIATPSGSDITARVAAADAPWLEGAAEKPKLTLGPP